MSAGDLSTGTPTTGWEYTYLPMRGINNASMTDINLLAKQGWRLLIIIPDETTANFPFLAILERALPGVTQ